MSTERKYHCFDFGPLQPVLIQRIYGGYQDSHLYGYGPWDGILEIEHLEEDKWNAIYPLNDSFEVVISDVFDTPQEAMDNLYIQLQTRGMLPDVYKKYIQGVHQQCLELMNEIYDLGFQMGNFK